MTVARALAVLAAVGTAAAPAAAQLPTGIVGGTNLIEAAGTPIPVGAPSSSDRTTAPSTRAMGGAGTISLGAVSASPGAQVPDRTDGAPVATSSPPPTAATVEPGAPIRVRRTQIVAGEAVRATTDTAQSASGRALGPGAAIVISGDGR